MHEYALLFPYHSGAPRAALLQNFERARRFNPGAPIVPLIHDGEPVFPGTIDVREQPSPFVTDDKWRSCDSMVYRWFQRRQLDARRYILYEWDMFSSVSVPEFYRSVWDADVAAVAPQTPEANPGWCWFQEIPALGKLAPFAAGLAPWAGVLLSARALQALSEAPPIPEVFCELRAGTLARAAGFEISPMPFARGIIDSHPDLIRFSDAPGIYHPIKWVVQPPAPRAHPREVPVVPMRVRRAW